MTPIEQVSNSTLVFLIAKESPGALEEFDRRFPVAADEPALWHEALQPGDKYEVNSPCRLSPDWQVRTFKCRRVGCLVSEEGGYVPVEHCRPLSEAAPWYTTAKPGDRLQRHGGAQTGRFVSFDKALHRVWWHADGAGSDAWTWASPAYFVPLPPAAPVVDNKASHDELWQIVSDVLRALGVQPKGSFANSRAPILAAIAAKDAEIAALKREMAKDRHFADERIAATTKAVRTIQSLRADLSACESLLRAERATVSRLDSFRTGVTRALIMGDFDNPDDTGIAVRLVEKLRASALVVPAEVLRAHPLPWKAANVFILDARGSTVMNVSLCAMGTDTDQQFVRAIVAAANGGAK